MAPQARDLGSRRASEEPYPAALFLPFVAT